MEEVEYAARELLRLAMEPRWSKTAASDAYPYMRTLRAGGFTNEQIASITGGRWGTSSVKKATAGTHVTAPDIATRVMTLFADAVAANITVSEVQHFLSARREANAVGVQVSEIIEFLAKIKEHQISLDVFFADYRKLKELGLTIQSIKELLVYKEALQERGFDLFALGRIRSAAEKYQTPDRVLVAIDAYGNLDSLNKAVEKAGTDLASRQAVLEQARRELAAHQELQRTSGILLDTYHELERALRGLASQLSQQLNRDISNTSADFAKETEAQLSKINENLQTLNASVTSNVKTLDETMRKATADSTKQIQDLAELGLQVGKQLEALEARANEAKPFMELLDLTKNPKAASPRVIATMTILMRAFLQWLDSSPAEIPYPVYLIGQARSLLKELEKVVLEK